MELPYVNYAAHVIERIKSRSKQNTSDCLEYIGNEGHKHGLISVTIDNHRKMLPASRAMYMAANLRFDLPTNLFVCHKCDNPRCVNINHLFVGTAKDNAQDMIAKGRQAKRHKLHTRKRKYTNDQILDVKSGKEPVSYYIAKYGMSNGYVSKLMNNKAKTLVF